MSEQVDNDTDALAALAKAHERSSLLDNLGLTIDLNYIEEFEAERELAYQLYGGNMLVAWYKVHVRPVLFPVYHAALLSLHEVAKKRAMQAFVDKMFESTNKRQS